MKVERVLTEKEEQLAEERFFRAIMTLKDVDEYRSFFNDICTPAEFESIKDRWSVAELLDCLLYTSPSPRDKRQSRMPSSA